MHINHRGHSPGHGEDNFTLYGDIRQRVRDREARGVPFGRLFLHVPANLSLVYVVLENLYFFLSRRSASSFILRMPHCSRHDIGSGMNFIFDLAMQ